MDNNSKGITNILNLLVTLQEEELTQEEIQKRFNIKKQTFYKYLKCFKDANFDVLKNKNRFKINKYAKNINLDSYDISIAAKICLVCENILSDMESDKAKEIINKILLMADSKTFKEVQKRFSKFRKSNNFNLYKTKINLFENFLKNNNMVEVTIKSKGKFIAKPYKITFKKNKVYFNFITNEGKIKTILAERIIDILPENLIKPIAPEEKETIFEIYGNLAKTYVLREDEIIISNFENGIRIANTQKDKNLLFKRLLRYDVLCKIIYPYDDKVKFKNLVDTALNNIGGV